ncbi:phosphoenolpyruvate hydrolase family protein [Ectothiorhodospiraceae bacterium WFHF3C12]|nr:phosphoenolpyruvate hydrolase family protein [Ectothiorhodospiraceae bacterium WFHF3C12]
MCADWTLMPVDQVHRRPRGRPVLVTLPWPATLGHDPWLGLLLPTRDYNRAMMEALGRTHLPEDCFVGLFLAHPFLDLDRWLDLLAGAGAAGLAAFPGITRLDGQFARTAEQAGLSHATETQRLAAAAEAGVATMASLGSAEFAAHTGGFRPDWLLSAVPGPPVSTPARGVVDYRPGTARAGTMTLHGRA